MDRSAYIGMSGAIETQRAQRISMNNLANIHTPGFRADFSELFAKMVDGDGFKSRAYAVFDKVSSNFAIGTLNATGNELDVALSEGGWMAVKNAAGEIRYSRRGDLTLDGEGFLMDGAGNKIMGSGDVISIPPAQKIDIGEDGTISIVPLGSVPGTKVLVDQIKTIISKPSDMFKTEEGLFALKEGAAIEDSTAMVRSGFLETSNVNPILELMDMLQLSKHHDLNVKLIESSANNDQVSAQIMRMGG